MWGAMSTASYVRLIDLLVSNVFNTLALLVGTIQSCNGTHTVTRSIHDSAGYLHTTLVCLESLSMVFEMDPAFFVTPRQAPWHNPAGKVAETHAAPA